MQRREKRQGLPPSESRWLVQTGAGSPVDNWSLSSLSERVSASKAGRLASLLAAALLEALRAVRVTGG